MSELDLPKTTWQGRLGGSLLSLYGTIVRKTVRYQISGLEHFQAAQERGPVLLTAWHGMTMMIFGFMYEQYSPDRSKLIILMPDDWRGEALAGWANHIECTPFPVNLDENKDTMVTARKLVNLVKMLKKGSDCYISPDGPDGPSYVPKGGVAFMAKKAKASVVPLGAYTRAGYAIKRWDQYVFPYPFSRVSLQFGAPVPIDGEREEVLERITAALHTVTMQAGANYYSVYKSSH